MGLTWGFWAHKEIHRHAIRSLPDEMRGFFEAFSREIIEGSVEADLRRSRDKKEGFYHYINIDRYGEYPFKELPRQYEKAVVKFGRGRVDSIGTLPWRIAEHVRLLERAFRENDTTGILLIAADLGHYISDAHVPLHTTENYDGQLTGQRGLHSRWESRIPEQFGPEYRFQKQPVTYWADPLEEAFRIVENSFLKVDSVLAADREVLASIPEGERWVERKRNGRTEYQYSDRYYDEFNRRLSGMVERQMNESIRAVADAWYTAWVNSRK